MEYVLVLLAVAFYFLPSIIGGKKRNTNAIFTLNLLLGWTVVGWIVALVWAMTTEPPTPTIAAPSATPATAARVAELKNLRDQGLLTQEEFMQQVGSL